MRFSCSTGIPFRIAPSATLSTAVERETSENDYRLLALSRPSTRNMAPSTAL